MTLEHLLHPVRDLGRELGRDLAAVALGLGLALVGGGFVIAAGYIALSRLTGNLWAALLMGAGLLVAAALVLAIRQSRRAAHARAIERARAAQANARDPLPSLVFDLAYLAASQIFARRPR